jgi:hypothetical protein
VSRDPGASYASETRQLVRQERLRPDGGGGGPSGLVVIAVVIAIIGLVLWVSLR